MCPFIQGASSRSRAKRCSSSRSLLPSCRVATRLRKCSRRTPAREGIMGSLVKIRVSLPYLIPRRGDLAHLGRQYLASEPPGLSHWYLHKSGLLYREQSQGQLQPAPYEDPAPVQLPRRGWTAQPRVAVLRAPWGSGPSHPLSTLKGWHNVMPVAVQPLRGRWMWGHGLPQGARSTATLGCALQPLRGKDRVVQPLRGRECLDRLCRYQWVDPGGTKRFG